MQEIQWEGGLFPHKTTGITEEEDMFSAVSAPRSPPRNLYYLREPPIVWVSTHNPIVYDQKTSVSKSLSTSSSFFKFREMAASRGSGNVISIESYAHFQTEMTKAGSKLVVVDFSASW